MFGRFFGGLLFAPLLAWFLMVTVGAGHSVSEFFPALSFQQALVIVLINAVLLCWYDSKDVPFFIAIPIHLVMAWPLMLLLGAFHGSFAWIPALGYWQTALISLPGLVVIYGVSLLLALFLGSASLVSMRR